MFSHIQIVKKNEQMLIFFFIGPVKELLINFYKSFFLDFMLTHCCFFFNKGTHKIKGIFLDLSNKTDIHLTCGALKNMPNLILPKFDVPKFISIPITNSKVHLDQGLDYLPKELRYVHWHQYPWKTLPFDFKPKKSY